MKVRLKGENDMRKFLLIFCLLILASCSEETKTQSYDEMKKMVVDALQTEEGKKAIRQVIEEPQFKELLTLEQTAVKTSIEETLLSDKAKTYWKEQFADPKFQETFAKSMKSEHEKLMKNLMNDSDYQQSLIDFFNQPDMQKQIETLLKSSAIRKQTEEVVKETIENPLMQSKWADLIRKTGEGENQKDEKSKDDQK